MIEDYVVVNGSGIGGLGGLGKGFAGMGKMAGGSAGGTGGMGIGGGIGAFVVWNVKVDTLEVCSFLYFLLFFPFSSSSLFPILTSHLTFGIYINVTVETGHPNNNPQTLQRIRRPPNKTPPYISKFSGHNTGIT